MEVFRTYLRDQYTSEHGFKTWTSQGDVVDCHGTQYVRTGTLMAEGLAGWHETPRQAKAAAADEIDARIQVLLAQARELRSNA